MIKRYVIKVLNVYRELNECYYLSKLWSISISIKYLTLNQSSVHTQIYTKCFIRNFYCANVVVNRRRFQILFWKLDIIP